MARSFKLEQPKHDVSHLLDGLNPEQREAAEHEEGPLLILAGAGSGKTRVMTHRIARLVLERGVDPEQILAVTFTNKAAGEMRERVDELLTGTNHIGKAMLSTFHSLCARLLRSHAPKLGLDRSFVIYDDKDQLALIKRILADEERPKDPAEARAKRSFIERQKNAGRTPEQAHEQAYDQNAEDDAFFYEQYQSRLRDANCLDFGDLILGALEIFRNDPKLAESYSTLWRYIMVDEFQDTNPAQFELLMHLTSTHKNLAVVGDDDQSIYRWRGATVQNILGFDDQFPETKVIKLEENYRSTQMILDAANDVIQHNQGRHDKKLWTRKTGGDAILFFTAHDDREEANYVVERIEQAVREGANYNDFAIFYRANSQARGFEEQLRFFGVPYQIVGGTSFYAREEVKDMLAYLKVSLNPKNEVDYLRVVNKPTRGVGNKTQDSLRIAGFAHPDGLWGATLAAAGIESSHTLGLPFPEVESLRKKPKKGVAEFVDIVTSIQLALDEGTALATIVTDLVNRLDYISYVNRTDPERAEDKTLNIEELINAMAAFEQEERQGNRDATSREVLQAFLEKSSLLASTDVLDTSSGTVTMMTVHSSKGLEFDTVFLVGMEDEVFPTARAEGDYEALEEERRLAYVAITRAKRKLFITNARRRRVRGQFRDTALSRFVRDIEEERIETDPRSAYRAPTGRRVRAGRTTRGGAPFGGGVDREEWAFDQTATEVRVRGDKPIPETISEEDFSQEIYEDTAWSEPEDTSGEPAELGHELTGKVVSHSRFGIGQVKSASGEGDKAILTIDFPTEEGTVEIVRKWVKIIG